jgi:hypothetical protein
MDEARQSDKSDTIEVRKTDSRFYEHNSPSRLNKNNGSKYQLKRPAGTVYPVLDIHRRLVPKGPRELTPDYDHVLRVNTMKLIP